MVLVDTVRWASRGKDAGSLDSGVSIGATEDAAFAASSEAWRHSLYFAKPSQPLERRDGQRKTLTRLLDHAVAGAGEHDLVGAELP